VRSAISMDFSGHSALHPPPSQLLTQSKKLIIIGRDELGSGGTVSDMYRRLPGFVSSSSPSNLSLRPFMECDHASRGTVSHTICFCACASCRHFFNSQCLQCHSRRFMSMKAKAPLVDLLSCLLRVRLRPFKLLVVSSKLGRLPLHDGGCYVL
jgi:hypothetical protein